MNFTETFIKRPVMTALVMFGIILFGYAGYQALPVSDLPSNFEDVARVRGLRHDGLL